MYCAWHSDSADLRSATSSCCGGVDKGIGRRRQIGERGGGSWHRCRVRWQRILAPAGATGSGRRPRPQLLVTGGGLTPLGDATRAPARSDRFIAPGILPRRPRRPRSTHAMAIGGETGAASASRSTPASATVAGMEGGTRRGHADPLERGDQHPVARLHSHDGSRFGGARATGRVRTVTARTRATRSRSPIFSSDPPTLSCVARRGSGYATFPRRRARATNRLPRDMASSSRGSRAPRGTTGPVGNGMPAHTCLTGSAAG